MTRSEAYKILEVSENSSEEEIKAAYKKLARKYHPDFYQNNPLASLAEEKLKEINEAYETIKISIKEDEKDKTEARKNNSHSGEGVIFYWEEYSWNVKNDLVKYNIFRKVIEKKLVGLLLMYEEVYKEYGSLREFLNRNPRYVVKELESVFETLVDVSIKHGYEMFSSKLLIKNYYNRVASDYEACYSECLEYSNRIDREREYKKEQKSINNEINRITGNTNLIGTAITGISNVYDKMSFEGKKAQFYKNPKVLKRLKESLITATYECMNVILELLKIDYLPADLLSNSILDNLEKYSSEKKKEKLFQALIYNPYNKEIYFKILKKYGDRNNELLEISNYFGVNLKYFKEKLIKEYIEQFKKVESNGIENKIEELRREVEELGENLEDYIDLEKEVELIHERTLKQLLEDLKGLIILEKEKAINEFKIEAGKLNIRTQEELEKIIEQVIKEKAKEIVEIYKKKAYKNLNEAENELLEKMNYLGLNVAEYINLEEVKETIAQRKKKNSLIKKIVLGLGLVGIIYFNFKDIFFKNNSDIISSKITNKKILNQSVEKEIDSYNNEKLYAISKGYSVRYTSFSKNDKQFGKKYVYFMFFRDGEYTYRISCSRQGNLDLNVYAGSGNFLYYTIPDLSKPDKIFSENIKTGKLEPLELHELSDNDKETLEKIADILKIFKEFQSKGIPYFEAKANGTALNIDIEPMKLII